MCRLLAYLGIPVTLEDLLFEPEYSLLRQSYAPRHQTYGRFNGDGWGVGWYDLVRRDEPARYRTPMPMWTDGSFASMAGLVSSTAVVAAVRSATPGFPIDLASTQPFTSGPWLLAHNGSIDGFREGTGAKLRRMLSERSLGMIEGSADSEVLFGLALDALDLSDSPGGALRSVIASVNEVAGGRMNLALCDGRRIAATSWGNSLYFLRDDRHGSHSIVIASEPYDDAPGWELIPDRSLVEAGPQGLEVRPL